MDDIAETNTQGIDSDAATPPEEREELVHEELVHEELVQSDDGRMLERRSWRGDQLHGNVESFDDEGQVLCREPFADGQLEGEAETFDTEGRLTQRASFVGGKLHGKVTTYDPEGRPLQRAEYRHGQLHGEMVLFAATDDASRVSRRQASMSYHQGALEGLLVTYDEQERPTFEVPYLKGVRQGLASWYQAGTLMRQATYVDDQLNGDLLDFHPNGRVRESTPYENDLAHGIAVRNYKNGKVKEKLRFHLGEQIGDSLQYNLRGQRLDKPRQGGAR